MKDPKDIDDTDPTEAAEEAEPYFPPTDPVVRVDRKGETRIAGGFGSGETPERHAQAPRTCI